MRYSDARDRFGLTRREWQLGNMVDTAEWLQRYKPSRVGAARTGAENAGRQAGGIEPGSGGMAGSGEGACDESLDAQAWQQLGEWMTGDGEKPAI